MKTLVHNDKKISTCYYIYQTLNITECLNNNFPFPLMPKAPNLNNDQLNCYSSSVVHALSAH